MQDVQPSGYMDQPYSRKLHVAYFQPLTAIQPAMHCHAAMKKSIMHDFND